MLIKRSFTLGGHRTSVALETAFWKALEEISEEKKCSITSLIVEIDNQRLDKKLKLASALRCYCLEYYKTP